MNVTECVPAGTRTPTTGVLPRGRPSKTTLEIGIELKFTVPKAAGWGGVGTGDRVAGDGVTGNGAAVAALGWCSGSGDTDSGWISGSCIGEMGACSAGG